MQFFKANTNLTDKFAAKTGNIAVRFEPNNQIKPPLLGLNNVYVEIKEGSPLRV